MEDAVRATCFHANEPKTKKSNKEGIGNRGFLLSFWMYFIFMFFYKACPSVLQHEESLLVLRQNHRSFKTVTLKKICLCLMRYPLPTQIRAHPCDVYVYNWWIIWKCWWRLSCLFSNARPQNAGSSAGFGKVVRGENLGTSHLSYPEELQLQMALSQNCSQNWQAV